MNRWDIENALRLTAILARIDSGCNHGQVANTVLELARISRSLNRIDCELCNGTTRESAIRNRQGRLLAKAAELIAPFPGVSVTHQGDPRGLSIKLTLPGGESHGWGDDWGI